MRDNFFDFAYVPKFNSTLQYLASLAQDEPWSSLYDNDLDLLRNYIFRTYERLNAENKILIDGDHACLNIGLYSKSNSEIYFLFSKNINPKNNWVLSKICEKADISLSLFKNLPERATYITNNDETIYDIRKELRVNITHILDVKENIKRIPQSIRDKPYLKILCLGAIEEAKVRITQNYKIAIFQFYDKKLQYLIPLHLTGKNIPDTALAVSIEENGLYIGHTVLTLEMAYSNARVICKQPMNEWFAGSPADIGKFKPWMVQV